MAENEGGGPESLNLYKKVFASILGPLEPLFTLGFGAVVKWVVLQGPAVLRVCVAASFLAFLISSAWFWYGFKGMEDLFLKGMAAKLDDPNQYYPGIEAIVLSDLQRDLPNSILGNTVSDDFIDHFVKLEETIADTSNGQTPQLSVVSAAGGALTDKYFIEPLSAEQLTPNQQATKPARSFLFVPAILVPQHQLTNSSQDPALIEALLKDPDLAPDLRMSTSVAESICSFTSIDLFTPQTESSVRAQPVQAYLITARGLMRICEGKTKDQVAYYSGQFEPATFFPSRTYFKNGVKALHPDLTRETAVENRSIGRVFTLTHPYIDLGGNGLVVTACRGIKTRANAPNDGTLCLDLGLSASRLANLKGELERLGGTESTVTCSSSPSVHCDSTKPWNKDLEQKINSLVGPSLLSDWYGKIQLIKQTPRALAFTIPIEQSFAQSGRSGTLLFSDVDLGQIQFRNLLKGACVSASVLAFVLFVLLLIADYGARIGEQDRAFQTVAGVMQDAPAAYVRLDSDDHFLELNEAFAKLVGFSSLLDARLQLKEKTFADLIADPESAEKYKKIDDSRRNGTPTKNYQIALKKIGGGQVIVSVHGAAVPNPVNPRHAIPQTFGIIIPVKSEGGALSEMPRRDAGA